MDRPPLGDITAAYNTATDSGCVTERQEAPQVKYVFDSNRGVVSLIDIFAEAYDI